MIPLLRIRNLAIGGAVALQVIPAMAQIRVDAARSASLQTTPATPALNQPGEGKEGIQDRAPRMEGDEEYGVQKILYRRANWEPFAFRLDAGAYYTSNVALTERGEQDDFFFLSGLALSYTPHLEGGWFGRAMLSDQIFRYDEAEVFDFDLMRGSAGFLYAFPRAGTAFDPILGDLILFADYAYYRISESWDPGEGNFDNHSVVLGLEKKWRFSRGHSVALGLTADKSFDASQDQPQRDEYAAALTYRVKWTSQLESAMGYRAAFYHYHQNDREDFNQVVSLGLEYKFTDWLSANASVSGSFNHSDDERLDYQALNTGAALFLTLNW